MFREILTNRYERPFLAVITILLIIIAVYNIIVSLLALIIIVGVYVLTRKNEERNREIQPAPGFYFEECRSGFRKAMPYRIFLSALPSSIWSRACAGLTVCSATGLAI